MGLSEARDSLRQTVPGAADNLADQNKRALDELQLIAYGVEALQVSEVGHKYELPNLPLPSDMRMKHRYNPVVVQITKLLMRDGKLSKAQRVSSAFPHPDMAGTGRG